MEKKKEFYSETYNEIVVLKKESHKLPYIECSRCGKDLKVFYVVQGKETGVEHAYLGTECVKHLS